MIRRFSGYPPMIMYIVNGVEFPGNLNENMWSLYGGKGTRLTKFIRQFEDFHDDGEENRFFPFKRLKKPEGKGY